MIAIVSHMLYKPCYEMILASLLSFVVLDLCLKLLLSRVCRPSLQNTIHDDENEV